MAQLKAFIDTFKFCALPYLGDLRMLQIIQVWALALFFVAHPLQAQDSTRTATGRRLTEPVNFKADSMHLSFKPPKIDSGILNGNAVVSYQNAKVEHERIELFFDISQVKTIAIQRENRTLKPKFTRDKESFTAQSLLFNFESGTGRIEAAKTQLEDGILHAEFLKNKADSVIFAQNALYTTCDEDHPHYHFRASRMKIVNKRWIFSGPIHLRVLNIPLPAWLPFGAIPTIEGRRSGPLRVQYGEDARGFYLRNMGYYWAASPYFDAQLTGGVWSGGSWQIRPQIRYAKRYLLDGSLAFEWTKSRSGERFDPDYLVADARRLEWSHNQQFSPTSRLSASVDLQTANNNRTATAYNQQVSQSTSSSIRYSKTFSKSSLSASILQSENFSTRQAQFSFPQINYTVNTRYPFQKQGGTSKKWYENLSYGYSFDFNNRYNFTPLSTDASTYSWYDGLKDNSIFTSVTGLHPLERLSYAATHNLPINATFNFTKTPIKKKPMRLSINPNVSYRQHWFGVEAVKSYNSSTSSVENNPIRKFNLINEFSSGINASTDVYGIFKAKIGKYERFRHTITPNVGFVFAPSYENLYRYYYKSSTDSVEYAIVPLYLSRVKQNALTFSLANLFQGKKVQRDSTGDERKEIINLFNLDLSGGYNFAATTLPWNDLNLSVRSRLFEKLDFSGNAQYTPYLLSTTGSTLNTLRIRQAADASILKGDLLSMRSASLSLSTAFRSKNAAARPVGNDLFNPNLSDRFSNQPINTPIGYSDFEIPWSLQLSATYRYLGYGSAKHHLILNNSFDFNLTPKWKIAGRSGFDFKTKQISNTSLSVIRDLHCWEMQFNIVPFGTYQSFNFSLYVKSGKLKEFLKISQPKQDVQFRF